jgi:hypothetical protein
VFLITRNYALLKAPHNYEKLRKSVTYVYVKKQIQYENFSKLIETAILHNNTVVGKKSVITKSRNYDVITSHRKYATTLGGGLENMIK